MANAEWIVERNTRDESHPLSSPCAEFDLFLSRVQLSSLTDGPLFSGSYVIVEAEPLTSSCKEVGTSQIARLRYDPSCDGSKSEKSHRITGKLSLLMSISPLHFLKRVCDV